MPGPRLLSDVAVCFCCCCCANAVDALMSIYNKLQGPKWNFMQLNEFTGRTETGAARWGGCSSCRVPFTHGSISTGSHGLHAASIPVPPYCCWHGVSCCNETYLSPKSSGNLFGTSFLQAAPSNRSCELYSVTALQLWGLGLTGPFHSILPELQLLHSHGLRHLDLSKNNLTGILPRELGSLANLTHLLLGSNSKWQGWWVVRARPHCMCHVAQSHQL